MKLFLDDERFPPSGKGEWLIVRSMAEAVTFMELHGCPEFISFDHDLGNDQTGYDLAKWMCDQDMNAGGKFFPSGFAFDVHSQNPVGARNIRLYLMGYLLSK